MILQCRDVNNSVSVKVSKVTVHQNHPNLDISKKFSVNYKRLKKNFRRSSNYVFFSNRTCLKMLKMFYLNDKILNKNTIEVRFISYFEPMKAIHV